AGGVDKVATIVADRPRERLIDEVVADHSKSLALVLTPDPQAQFVWSKDDTEPLYLHAERFAAGIRSLNASLNEYSQALVGLSSETLIDTAKLDQLAKDMNGNARAAAV